jgi:hypothetical protein
MDNNKFIEAIQAFEAGKEVRCKYYDGSVSGLVINGHVWRSDNTYTVIEQPKTVTIETWSSDCTGSINSCISGGSSSKYFKKENMYTLIKTETIEVPE